MSKKFASTVTGASLIIIFFSVLSKILGMFREIIFANSFGLSKSYELFLVSIVIPTIFNTFILYVGINFFIPQYNRIKSSEGEEATNLFLNKSITLFFISSTVIAGIILLFARSIISLFLSGVHDSEFQLAVNVLKIIVITIPFNGITAIVSAYLQAKYDFFNAYLSQFFLNLGVILIVLLLSGTLNIYSIPLGFAIGSVGQTLFLLFVIRKSIYFKFLFKSEIQYFTSFPLKIFLLTVLIELMGQLYVFVDRMFYHSVEQGGIAAINYATTVFIIPLSILSMAFSNASFPKLSAQYSEGNLAAVNESLNSVIGVTLVVFVPTACIFIFHADYLIASLFKRGKFSPEDTLMTGTLLTELSFSIVFFAVYTIVNKFLFSVKELSWLFIISFTAIVVKVVASILLVPDLKQYGLAIASSVSYASYLVLGLVITNRYLPGIQKSFFRNFIFYVLSGLLTYLLADLVIKFLLPGNSYTHFLSIIIFLLFYFGSLLATNDSYLLRTLSAIGLKKITTI